MDSKKLAALLRIRADALRVEASTLDAIADQAEHLVSADELLDLERLQEEFGYGRDAILAAADRDGLEVNRGARSKLLVRRSVMEAYVRDRKRPRRTQSSQHDLDWDAVAAESLKGLREKGT